LALPSFVSEGKYKNPRFRCQPPFVESTGLTGGTIGSIIGTSAASQRELEARVPQETTTFGSRIAGRRRMLDRSQEWLAKQTGVSTRFVSKLENNAAAPSWDTAKKLAKVLEVPLDFLAFGDGK
jgi:DNA-binding XRE family transcriptional regulator